jgi:YggT family protein
VNNPIIEILSYVILFFQIAIIGRAIMSWFDQGMRNPISQFLFQVTEPLIAPVRQFMPRTGFIDLSPMIVLIILFILQRLLAGAAV